jgi:hypothetical protein
MEPAAAIRCEDDFQRWLWKTLERERQRLAAEVRARESNGLRDLDIHENSARGEGDPA